MKRTAKNTTEQGVKSPDDQDRRIRRLTEDEEQLWQQVAQTIKRSSAKPITFVTDARTGAGARKPPDGSGSTAAAGKPVRRSQAEPYSPPVSFPSSGRSGSPGPSGSPTSIDLRSSRKLARGQLAIDDRIDLHGMSQTEAHRRLEYFLNHARQSGMRHVLVITGKGRSSGGVLRQLVPLWLGEASLSCHVSAYRQAHVSHGGEGALYVRLRRAGRYGSGSAS